MLHKVLNAPMFLPTGNTAQKVSKCGILLVRIWTLFAQGNARLTCTFSKFWKGGTLEIKQIVDFIHNLRLLFFSLVGATEATALESCKQIKNYCNKDMNSTRYIIQLGGSVERQHCNMTKGDYCMFNKFTTNTEICSEPLGSIIWKSHKRGLDMPMKLVKQLGPWDKLFSDC